MQVDYEKDEYHETRHSELLGNDELMNAWSECASKFYFKDIKPEDSIFEFGGAFGYNLRNALKTNTCTMLELSALGRSIGEKSGIRSVSKLEELENAKFDVILCRHVLEHVDSPLTILNDLRNHLTPKGRLILVLPVEGNGDLPVQNEIDFHLYLWNPRTISNLAKRAGFSDVQFRYNYFNGRRVCLPIFRKFGGAAYSKAIQMVGLVSRSKELILECR